ncbi:MAG: hypothetical protein WDM79_10680 [Terricaulis sp.]
MTGRIFLLCIGVFVLTACDRVAAPEAQVSEAPKLEAPAPDSEPARGFAPVNEAATAATGELTVSMMLRMPDAAEADRGAAPTDVLTLRGETGVLVDAQISGTVTPATMVEGQTLRALLGLPVEASQTLVYSVGSETKPESGRGLCGTDTPAFVVVWEPEGPGETTLKVLGVIGGAPGSAGARPCPMLEYRRS